MGSFYWNTVSPFLRKSLTFLISSEIFEKFRLVGGTALSLHLGHRISVDIDLFTDSEYGSINFDTIDKFLKSNFKFVLSHSQAPIGFGKSYIISQSKSDAIKLDLYYTEKFVDDAVLLDDVRLASVAEIGAMKIDVVQRGGRKKDFWDIHELLESLTLNQLLDLHHQKYPYIHDRELILKNIIDFANADNEPDPICLKGKYWELIKLDIIEELNQI